MNALELVSSKYDNEPIVIGALLEGNLKIFEGRGCVDALFKFIKKSTKRKQITLHTKNLNSKFGGLAWIAQKYEKEIKIFAAKGDIYYVKMALNEKTELIIKDIEKLMPWILEEDPGFKEIQFYPGTFKKAIKILRYTQQNSTSNKEFQELYDKLKEFSGKGGEGEEEEEEVNFFEKREEILDNEEIKKKEKEIPKHVKTNLILINKNLKTLDSCLKVLIRGYKYNYSLASITVRIFEENFNNYETALKISTTLDEIIRKGFVGGRCEVFGNLYLSTENLYHFDFKNMYAEIMLSLFPTGTLILEEGPKTLNKMGFYFVTIKSQKMKIPILPTKLIGGGEENEFVWEEGVNDSIIYTNGEFDGLYYKEELDLFIKNGGLIKKLHYAYVYNGDAKPIFKRFAENLIDLRGITKKSLWKKLLVSFYGKLGAAPYKTKSILGKNEDFKQIVKNETIVKEVWFGNFFIVEVEKEKKDETESRVDYAAIITARARIKLWESIKRGEGAGGRILYCDTDGMFMAFDKLNETGSKKEGEVRWSRKTKNEDLITDAVFAGTRSYSIKSEEKWETKIAGIPRNSIEFETFKTNFYNSNEEELRIKTTRRGVFEIQNEEKTIKINLKKYKKRILSRDKKKTKPLIIVNGLCHEDPFVDFK